MVIDYDEFFQLEGDVGRTSYNQMSVADYTRKRAHPILSKEMYCSSQGKMHRRVLVRCKPDS